jgi:hypothetical protein
MSTCLQRTASYSNADVTYARRPVTTIPISSCVLIPLALGCMSLILLCLCWPCAQRPSNRPVIRPSLCTYHIPTNMIHKPGKRGGGAVPRCPVAPRTQPQVTNQWPTNVSKHVAATSKFYVSEGWRHASSLLKTQNSGVTCERHY